MKIPSVVSQPGCSRDPAVSPGISNAAVMLAVRDKTAGARRSDE